MRIDPLIDSIKPTGHASQLSASQSSTYTEICVNTDKLEIALDPQTRGSPDALTISKPQRKTISTVLLLRIAPTNQVTREHEPRNSPFDHRHRSSALVTGGVRLGE